MSRGPYREAYLWYVVLFLTAASTLAYIDRQILALMVGPVKRDLGLTDTQIGLLVGLAFSLFYCAVTVPMAWLADTRSRRTVIGAGILAWSGLTALSGLARSYLELFLARMGVGLGEATLGPSAYSLLADLFSKERLPFAVGVFAAAPFIGIGLANIVGGSVVQVLENMPPIEVPLVGAVRSWQMTFFVLGIPGVMLALLAWTIAEPSRRGRAKGTELAQGAPWSDVIRFMRERRAFFALHFLGFLGLAMQGWTVFAWVVEFFVRNHGMSRADIGMAYGLIALGAGLPGSIIAGRIATALLRRGTPDATLRLVILATCVMGPLSVVMPFVDAPWGALALLVPITFFMSWPPGLGVAALQAVAPNELRGRVIACYLLFVNFLSFTLGPLLVGFFNDSIFQSEAAIGRTLATLAALNYPFAAVCLLLCLRQFRSALQSSLAWQ